MDMKIGLRVMLWVCLCILLSSLVAAVAIPRTDDDDIYEWGVETTDIGECPVLDLSPHRSCHSHYWAPPTRPDKGEGVMFELRKNISHVAAWHFNITNGRPSTRAYLDGIEIFRRANQGSKEFYDILTQAGVTGVDDRTVTLKVFEIDPDGRPSLVSEMCIYTCCDWDGDGLDGKECGGPDNDDFVPICSQDFDTVEFGCMYNQNYANYCKAPNVLQWNGLVNDDASQCCGNDADDTGRSLLSDDNTQRFMCGIVNENDKDGSNYWWASSHQVGDVLLSNRSGNLYELVAANNNWYACGYDYGADTIKVNFLETAQVAEPTTSIYHHYLCYQDPVSGVARFGECIGTPTGEEDNSLNANYEFGRGSLHQAGGYAPVLIGFDSVLLPNISVQAPANMSIIQSTPLATEGPGPMAALKVFVTLQAKDPSALGNVSVYIPPTRLNGYTDFYLPFYYGSHSAVEIVLADREGGKTYTYTDILQYSTNGVENNTWHLLKLPNPNLVNLTELRLVFKASYANYQPTAPTEFMIGPLAASGGATKPLQYCSQYTQRVSGTDILHAGWTKELDDPNSAAACQQLRYAGYTGTRCCGDDSSSDLNYFKHSEFYNDTSGVCWQGEKYTGTQLLQYFDIAVNTKPYQYTCHTPICQFSLPAFTGTKLNLSGPDAKYANFTSPNTGLSLGNGTNETDAILTLSRNKPNILITNNQIFGCAVQPAVAQAKQTNNQGQVTANLLLNNTIYTLSDGESCRVEAGYLCDLDGTWKNNQLTVEDGVLQPASNLTKLSKQHNATTFACCPESYCWSGTTCIADMSTKPNKLPIDMDLAGNGNRCIDGFWKYSIKKYDFSNQRSGYCADNSQCYLNDNQCVNSGVTYGDFYCEAGNWSTRTKVLANQLLSFAQARNNFVLYCDSFERTLNYVGRYGEVTARQLITGEQQLSSIFTNYTCNIGSTPQTDYCTNNFCVLLQGEKVVLGTSLNAELARNNTLPMFLNISTCNITPGQERTFVRCKDGWFYQKEMGLLIYESGNQGFIAAIGRILEAIFRPVVDLFVGLFGTGQLPANVDRLPSTTHFNKLYYAVQGGKTIRAVYEERPHTTSGTLPYIGIEYVNVGNVCNALETYDGFNAQDDFSCTTQGATTRVASLTSVSPATWVELTASLRIE